MVDAAGNVETLTDALTMSFMACGAEENRTSPSCNVTVTSQLTGLSETINYQFQRRNQTNNVNIFGSQAGSDLRDELAFRALTHAGGLNFVRAGNAIEFESVVSQAAPLKISDELGTVRSFVQINASGIRR